MATATETPRRAWVIEPGARFMLHTLAGDERGPYRVVHNEGRQQAQGGEPKAGVVTIEHEETGKRGFVTERWLQREPQPHRTHFTRLDDAEDAG